MKTQKPKRQGDVYLEPVDALPAGAKLTQQGSVLVAQGSAIANRHRFESNANGHQDGDTLYVEVLDGGASLIHEEHRSLDFAPGFYRSIQQRELEGSEVRNVLD